MIGKTEHTQIDNVLYPTLAGASPVYPTYGSLNLKLKRNVHHALHFVRFHLILESPLGGFHVLTGSSAVSDVADLDSFDQCNHYADDTLVGESLTITCDVALLARYVAIVRRQSGVKLHFCDVEVLAGLRTFV